MGSGRVYSSSSSSVLLCNSKPSWCLCCSWDPPLAPETCKEPRALCVATQKDRAQPCKTVKDCGKGVGIAGGARALRP